MVYMKNSGMRKMWTRLHVPVNGCKYFFVTGKYDILLHGQTFMLHPM